MKKKTLISVIIPVYNVQDYITECLESIIEQSYSNLEIIIVNDGSTDNSSEICREYMARDNRIIFVEKENGGASTARNFGLDHATGDFISFVDSDDFIHKDYFKILLDNIEDNQLVFCNFSEYHSDQPKHEINIEEFNSFESIEFTSTELLKKITTFKRPLVIVPWGKIFDKNIWHNLRFIENKTHEDEFIVHHFIDETQKIKFIDLPLYYYRQNREGSVMSTLTKQKIRDYYDACIDREAFFLQKGMKDEASKIYNNGKSYLIRNLLKLKIKTEETSIKSVLKDKKLFLSTKLELLLKIFLRR